MGRSRWDWHRKAHCTILRGMGRSSQHSKTMHLKPTCRPSPVSGSLILPFTFQGHCSSNSRLWSHRENLSTGLQGARWPQGLWTWPVVLFAIFWLSDLKLERPVFQGDPADLTHSQQNSAPHKHMTWAASLSIGTRSSSWGCAMGDDKCRNDRLSSDTSSTDALYTGKKQKVLLSPPKLPWVFQSHEQRAACWSKTAFKWAFPNTTPQVRLFPLNQPAVSTFKKHWISSWKPLHDHILLPQILNQEWRTHSYSSNQASNINVETHTYKRELPNQNTPSPMSSLWPVHPAVSTHTVYMPSNHWADEMS